MEALNKERVDLNERHKRFARLLEDQMRNQLAYIDLMREMEEIDEDLMQEAKLRKEQEKKVHDRGDDEETEELTKAKKQKTEA